MYICTYNIRIICHSYTKTPNLASVCDGCRGEDLSAGYNRVASFDHAGASVSRGGGDKIWKLWKTNTKIDSVDWQNGKWRKIDDGGGGG